MKPRPVEFPELLFDLAFILYLLASSLTHIERGAELSLWLMTFAVLLTMATTVLPWLGIRWLRLEQKGSRAGGRLSMFLQVASWASFAYAMFLRLSRNLPQFHVWITLTTLLWAAWLLIFIYSRHAWADKKSGDTLNPEEEHRP